MNAASPFRWYELRTTDTTAACDFYERVLGLEARTVSGRGLFLAEGRPCAAWSTLPAAAASRGAPAHWLGHVGVRDAELSQRRMVELGGQRLGPPPGPSPAPVIVVRDPFGAVLGLNAELPAASSAVAWHELNTTDRESALRVYGELFGWSERETLELGLEVGPYQLFAASEHGPATGGIVASALQRHVHPHWLFYFRSSHLDSALVNVSAHGGNVVHGPVASPSGGWVAYCEDPQGAAFGLFTPA